MTSEDRDAFRSQLVEHEGERLLVYRCPAGYLTVGVGRNLEGKGLTKAESRFLLDNDITEVEGQCQARFPAWFPSLNGARQRAILDLVFNMGIERFCRFTSTIGAFERGNYEAAADHLIRSKWYGQVGRRAVRIVAMVRTGVDPGLRP
jgi:lysozyme